MKRVFVTGASHGIGRAIVEAFTSVGDCVAFCDIDTLRGKEVEQATGARFFALDVCNKAALEEAVQSLLAEWGDIDIIVNNAGFGVFGKFDETDLEKEISAFWEDIDILIPLRLLVMVVIRSFMYHSLVI